jgi:osmotically-inducible protein OsmY
VTGVVNKIEVKPRLSPSDVQEKIEEALRRSAELDARRIRVEVDGTEVKLHGAVRSMGREGRGRTGCLVGAWHHQGRKPYHGESLTIK